MKTSDTSKRNASKTVRIELSGGFHNVKPITMRVAREKLPTTRVGSAEFFDIFSRGQLDRLDKHFCGITDCTCGAYERATVHIEVSKGEWIGIDDLPIDK